ncbi:MAG: NAD(P)-dependent oxidoreductase [Gemmatimonadota bacterium]
MSRRPRVLNAEPWEYSPRARRVLERFADVEDGPVDRAALVERARAVDALIVRLGHRVDAEVLGRPSRLQAVVTATTGLDHVDLGAAEAAGVAVLSLRGERAFLEGIRATVEHTFALLLTLLRRTHRASAHVEAGGWERDRFRGHELAGRTLGIVGLGRIGTAVAELGTAFRMPVLAYDPFREGWPGTVERASSLADLLGRAQVLSLHVPLADETRNLIGSNELGLLPEGAFVINTARGGVLDEDALLAALDTGRLGGAALDVLQGEEEGRPLRPALLERARGGDRLVVTPHIGGATWESMEKTEVFMAEKLEAALMGAAAGKEGA